ncbi:DNA adenine methylase [Neobacillus vireti]|uniref:DNA adenine methylase n=1 Tax=Neobacillus vireti TaxID=220686 RepID=UPI002FFEFA28
MNSPIKWQGGKRNLRKEIINLIPEHNTYVEPFAGGLWVFFGKDKSKVEVINDVDKDLITFYNVLKNNIDSFMEKFDTYLISREEFNYLKTLSNNELDNIMIAYKFFYLNKNSFGGTMTSFNSYHRDKPYLNDNALKLLKKAHQRLKNVWIENMDYSELISKFDTKDSFFYLDPPYYETNNGGYKYGKDIDFKGLHNLLRNMKGKFLLSINDHEYIKELFKDFYIKEIEVRYNISKDSKGREKFGELLIANYDISNQLKLAQ